MVGRKKPVKNQKKKREKKINRKKTTKLIKISGKRQEPRKRRRKS